MDTEVVGDGKVQRHGNRDDRKERPYRQSVEVAGHFVIGVVFVTRTGRKISFTDEKTMSDTDEDKIR